MGIALSLSNPFKVGGIAGTCAGDVSLCAASLRSSGAGRWGAVPLQQTVWRDPPGEQSTLSCIQLGLWHFLALAFVVADSQAAVTDLSKAVEAAAICAVVVYVRPLKLLASVAPLARSSFSS